MSSPQYIEWRAGVANGHLKHSFRDGTTHVVLDPIDFMRHILRQPVTGSPAAGRT